MLWRRYARLPLSLLFSLAVLLLLPLAGFAQDPIPPASGGEAHLILPDLSIGTFFGVDGRTLLMAGLAICAWACCLAC